MLIFFLKVYSIPGDTLKNTLLGSPSTLPSAKSKPCILILRSVISWDLFFFFETGNLVGLAIPTYVLLLVCLLYLVRSLFSDLFFITNQASILGGTSNKAGARMRVTCQWCAWLSPLSSATQVSANYFWDQQISGAVSLRLLSPSSLTLDIYVEALVWTLWRLCNGTTSGVAVVWGGIVV